MNSEFHNEVKDENCMVYIFEVFSTPFNLKETKTPRCLETQNDIINLTELKASEAVEDLADRTSELAAK